MAATAPDANGIAIDQFIPPIAIADMTPAAETSAITASEVDTMDCM